MGGPVLSGALTVLCDTDGGGCGVPKCGVCEREELEDCTEDV